MTSIRYLLADGEVLCELSDGARAESFATPSLISISPGVVRDGMHTYALRAEKRKVDRPNAYIIEVMRPVVMA